MKRITLISLMLLLPLFASGQELLQKVLQASRFETLQANFTSTKTSELLAAPVTTTGSVAFRAPDCLRWEVDGGSVFVMNPSSRRKMPDVAGLKGFNITQEGEDALILLPSRHDLKRLFTRIVLKVDPADGSLRALTLEETNGDVSFIEFSSVRIDEPIDDSLFNL